MNDIENYIISAEEKWLNSLLSYCKKLFDGKKILSHDHTHHLRVWEYSKEILNAISNSFDIDNNFIEATLIASLFHDTGLTQNLNEDHGNDSRIICSDYFENVNLKKPENFNEILHAIEMHDDKNYKQENIIPNSILAVLSAADDLDAFGNIGVIRYTEIYLLRGISLNDLPKSIIQNLDNRFANFERTYKNFPKFVEKHKDRYLASKKFFENLKKEL
ncbi:MAG: HD domain-containing protein [Bacteroidales bacterium]|nr:HD domain-containing protein [Bacteroidales bacterium]